MKKHNKSTCWLYQKRLKILITHPQLIEKDLRRNGVAHDQCATGNPVPVPVDFFRSGSGPVPAKYRPDRPDLTSKFGCRI